MIYYVYALLDPRKDNQPFYIGKGSKNRDKQHLTEELHGENVFKDSVIDRIRAAGLEPIIERIQENMSENAAYDYEEWLIAFFGRRNQDVDGILTNIISGGKGGSSLFLKGIPKSKETRQKMSQYAKNRPEAHKRNNVESHKRTIKERGQKYLSDKAKKAAETRKRNGNNKPSEETVEKRRESLKKTHKRKKNAGES